MLLLCVSIIFDIVWLSVCKLGSVGLCCLMLSRSSILILMSAGKSLCLLLILPLGMLCLSAFSIMFVIILFDVCTFVGVFMSVRSSSMSCLNFLQSALL